MRPRTLSLQKRQARGSAMLVALGALLLMLTLGVAVLGYASNVSADNTRRSRETRRFDCALSGLQLARGFYGYNFSEWNNYLGDPGTYNALLASNWPSPGPLTDPFSTASGSLRAAHPELFIDLDGDLKPDVYLYIRDNLDEPGTLQNRAVDLDGRVYVGALCISTTMSQKLSSVAANQNVEIAEALISPATHGLACTQAGCGNGANNLN